MSRTKKSLKAKEPIKLRLKSLSNGNKSLYLDYYKEGVREYEFLKLYLIPETSPESKQANANTLQAANAIKAARLLELTNGKAGIKTANKNLALSDWIDTIIKKREQAQVSQATITALKCLKKHLQEYKPGVKLVAVNRGFCVGFADYLRTAKSFKCGKDKEPKQLSNTTQRTLLSRLSLILNEAIRAELIANNPNQLLTSTERIKKEETTREYLTANEVKKLIVTPIWEEAQHDKEAFLFCCFCGLRYSDVKALQWGNIKEESGKMRIEITMQKTGTAIIIPLSKEAINHLPERKGAKDSDPVFNLPKDYLTTYYRIQRLGELAGINKNLTFHISRHTFATLMLTAGADLYTTSKLLGHKEISTTQIYARIIDKKKAEAVNLLNNLF